MAAAAQDRAPTVIAEKAELEKILPLVSILPGFVTFLLKEEPAWTIEKLS